MGVGSLLQRRDLTWVQHCQTQRSRVLPKNKEGAAEAEVLQLSREGLVVILAPAAGHHRSRVLRCDAQTCFIYSSFGYGGGVWLVELCDCISAPLLWVRWFCGIGLP